MVHICQPDLTVISCTEINYRKTEKIQLLTKRRQKSKVENLFKSGNFQLCQVVILVLIINAGSIIKMEQMF